MRALPIARSDRVSRLHNSTLRARSGSNSDAFVAAQRLAASQFDVRATHSLFCARTTVGGDRPRCQSFDPADLGGSVRRQVYHRSISPNTISSEPRIAVMSASMCPRLRKSIAWRCANEGARILHLYGRLVPSDTR